MKPLLVALLAVGMIGRAPAQRLLWETVYNPPASVGSGTGGNGIIYCYLTPARQLLTACFWTAPIVTGCPNSRMYRQAFRLYDLNGTLLRDQAGRRTFLFDQGLGPGTGSRFWWTGTGLQCLSNAPNQNAYVQRLRANGDTLTAWAPLAATPTPKYQAGPIMEAGRQVLTGGYDYPSGVNGQVNRQTLTAVDTATGRVRWRYAYDRPGFANDKVTDMVRTPRGGYLLTGDGQVLSPPGFQHLFLETDSLGRQLKQRLIYPLGPAFTSGARYLAVSNLVALPNAGGYLAPGVADSLGTGGFTHNERAYLLRLDTALNVTWVYRNPPDLLGSGNVSQRANKVRLLANGTAVLLVRDLRGNGLPDLQLVQIDLATGRRVGRPLVLSSNTQYSVVPLDWDFLGDGTLVVCGRSSQVGVSTQQGWLARFDLRGTPLATAQPLAETMSTPTFTLYPNPSTGPVTLNWQLPPAARAGQLRLYSVLGQLVKTLPLPPTASGRLEVAGLAPGLYLARLLDAAGAGQGRAQRLLVRE